MKRKLGFSGGVCRERKCVFSQKSINEGRNMNIYVGFMVGGGGPPSHE